MKVYILLREPPPGGTGKWYIDSVYSNRKKAEEEKSEILKYGSSSLKIESHKVIE